MKKRMLMLSAALLAACCSFPALAQESGGEQLSAADQQRRITGNVEEWKPADKTGSYTVTDLDQNGSLEILSADYDDETKETVTKIWEVSPEGQLVPCELPWEEGDSQPDLITASAQVYYDEAEDTYYYMFQDASAGSETAETAVLSLKDGVVTEERLDEETAADRFEGMEEMTASFKWVSTAEHALGSDVPMEQILTLIEGSYAGFSMEGAKA